jgi:hypothetical protein
MYQQDWTLARDAAGRNEISEATRVPGEISAMLTAATSLRQLQGGDGGECPAKPERGQGPQKNREETASHEEDSR